MGGHVTPCVSPRQSPLGRAGERRLAAALFNRTWDLLSQKRRSGEEDEELVRTAHASTYHWYRVGTLRNLSIAEWQLSRVYSMLGEAHPALHHAERSLRLANRAHLAPFYTAYAHEALARAHSVAGSEAMRKRHLRAARHLAARIRNVDDRRMLEEDLATIRPEATGASRRRVRRPSEANRGSHGRTTGP